LSSSQPFPGVRFHGSSDSAGADDTAEQPDNSNVGGADGGAVRRSVSASSNSVLFGPHCSAVMTPKGMCESIQGTRATMEDTWTCIDCLTSELPALGDSYHFSYYGVYDGHCGDQAARLCRDQLHRRVAETPHFLQGNVEQAFITGMLGLDRAIIQAGQDENWNAGATVASAFIVDGALYTANLGDSLVVLAQRTDASADPTAVVLATVHKATVPDEKKRIIDAGGMVMSGRVFGDLAISRAVGDKQYKKPVCDADFISSVPHTTKVLLSPTQHEFIVLATDGLWDKVTPQETVKHVAALRAQTPQPSVHEIARSLVDLASQRASSDNITVLVVILNWSKDSSDNDIACISE
jgi:protein phosphatase PTC2/3